MPARTVITGTFTLPPELASATEVEVVNEDRTIPVVDGAFEDVFDEEWTHHIYRVPITPPEELPAGIATTLETSIVHGGAEFFFTSDLAGTIPTTVEVGYYVDGQPFAVSNQPLFYVSRITPDSVQIMSAPYSDGVLGSLPATPYWANGMAVDPYIVYNVDPQGFDGLLGQYPTGNQSASVIPYSHALNKDPGATGTSYAVATGASHSLVKSIRIAGKTTPTVGVWEHFEDWCVLHIVPTVPPVGAFAPGASDLDKTSRYTTAMIDKTVLGTGFTRSTGMPSLATCNSNNYFTRSFMPFFGTGADEQRRIMVDDSGAGGYSRDYGKVWCDHYAAMLSIGGVVADATRDAALITSLAYAATIIGLINRSGGTYGGHGAGQHCGSKQFAQLFGHAFHAAGPAGVMAKCLSFENNVHRQQFWATSAVVGKQQFWPNTNAMYFHSFTDEDVGRPYFSSEVTYDVDGITPTHYAQYNSDFNTDYELTSMTSTFPEMMNILLLKNGPSGWNGGQVLAQSASDFSSANPRAAAIAYYDRYATYTMGLAWSTVDPHETRFRNYWNDRRGDVVATIPRWVGTPDAFTPRDTNIPTYVFPVSGGFGWNFTTVACATQAITAYQIQYSLDMISWIDVASPGATGSKTGLLVTPTYVRWRRQSAAGWGPWSLNGQKFATYSPDNVDEGERYLITPTGSPSAAAPVFTLTPKLWKRTYRVSSSHHWTDATGLTLSTAEAGDGVQCGTGYLTGHPAPTLTYQKVRDGTPVGSASSNPILTEEDSDVGALISCKVTATNASGSVNVTTAGVNWRELPAPGAAFVGRTFATGTYLERTTALSGVADGMAFTICFKYTPAVNVTTQTLFLIRSSPTVSKVLVQRLTSNSLRIRASNAAGTVVFSKDLTGFTVAGGEKEVLFSYNSDIPTGYAYVNGTNVYGTPTTATADQVIDLLAGNDTEIATDAGGSALKMMYFDDSFLDLSNATIRGKFATPILLGADGSGLSGTIPAICFYSSTDDSEWEINRGSGGSFTLVTP